jgi:hypothetical protein
MVARRVRIRVCHLAVCVHACECDGRYQQQSVSAACVGRGESERAKSGASQWSEGAFPSACQSTRRGCSSSPPLRPEMHLFRGRQIDFSLSLSFRRSFGGVLGGRDFRTRASQNQIPRTCTWHCAANCHGGARQIMYNNFDHLRFLAGWAHLI